MRTAILNAYRPEYFLYRHAHFSCLRYYILKKNTIRFNKDIFVNMKENVTVSVIVPLAKQDDMWRQLLSHLQLPPHWELLIAASAPPPPEWRQTPHQQWIECARVGRAAQMNIAAAKATGVFLWFVHADSHLPMAAATKLQHAITSAPQALHYFDLRFYDGGWRMAVNEWGVRIRCAIFGNPFGDQALCIARDKFTDIGGYSETATAGEDHIFVLRAARAGASARRVGESVKTSARAYIQNGWWRTVWIYQKIWWRQWRQAR